MNLQKCVANHFYDADKYAACPHCKALNGGIHMGDNTVAMKDIEMQPASYDGNKTVSVDQSSREHWSISDEETQSVLPPNVNFFGDIESLTEEKTVSLVSRKKEVYPVVGWLVCIEGASYGKSFVLKENKNFIGRAASSDVVLATDNNVSREKHAIIVYEPRSRVFIALPGESQGLYYINDKVVLSNEELNAYDIISIGKEKLMFIPFCGKQFGWEDLNKDES